MVDEAPDDVAPPDLLRGGLFFRLLRRFGVDIAEARGVALHAATVGLVGWIPMVVLCAIDGTLFPGRVDRPLLFDVAGYVRPLLTLPLFIVAEPVLGGAWRTAVLRLVSRGIVPREHVPALEAVIRRTVPLRDRLIPEAACALLAAAFAADLFGSATRAGAEAWFGVGAPGSVALSPAGAWYLIFVFGGGSFLLLRWVWRITVWHVLLYRISRLPLRLSPVHPDRACGLEFLARPIEAYSLLAFAMAASLAGRFANQMIHGGAPLIGFAVPGGVFAGIVLVLLLLPTVLIFAPSLIRARRDALVAIGSLAAECGNAFLGPRGAPDGPQPAPGGPALQDVYTAVDAIRAVRPVPLGLATVAALLLSMALPALGLALLEIPAADILDRITKLVF